MQKKNSTKEPLTQEKFQQQLLDRLQSINVSLNEIKSQLETLRHSLNKKPGE